MIPERFRHRIFLNEIKDRQIRKAEREGRELLEENITMEASRSLVNKGRWPAGSVFLYAAECVYGPMPKKDGKARK